MSEFAPGRIVVAMTTRNRREMAQRSAAAWLDRMPADSHFYIVDDASDVPYPNATFRFRERVGIARAKNECLRIADDAGAEHIFLVDDDTYPSGPWWSDPYVNSPEQHLMHIFPHDGPGSPKVMASTDHLVAWTWACGNFLYLHRNVLDVVGGYDTGYGTWGHEHIDYSNRIHNAGLTSFRFQDVPSNVRAIECLDETGGIERSVPQGERDKQYRKNVQRFSDNLASRARHSYRASRNIVMTTWLTTPDPQRGNRIDDRGVDVVAKPLFDSVMKQAEGTAFVALSNDGWKFSDRYVTDWGLGPYLSRWVNQEQWLRKNTWVDNVFMVDAGDVVMQRTPWPEVKPGHLYVGYEPYDIAGNQWLADNHRSMRVQSFLHDVPVPDFAGQYGTVHRPLLNCGVVGGDRETVLELLRDMLIAIEDHQTDHLMYGRPADQTEMGLFNMVCYQKKWHRRIVTGSNVVTLFKKHEVNNVSWWRHK